MIIHQLRRLLCRTRKPVKVINVLGNARSCHKADSLRSMMSAVSEELTFLTAFRVNQRGAGLNLISLHFCLSRVFWQHR